MRSKEFDLDSKRAPREVESLHMIRITDCTACVPALYIRTPGLKYYYS